MRRRERELQMSENTKQIPDLLFNMLKILLLRLLKFLPPLAS